MTSFIQSDDEIPTVLGLDAASGNFILGAEAKELQLQAKTGLLHFKKLAGEVSSKIERASALWYLDGQGKPQTLTLTETLQHYFRLLDSGGDTPRSYFVGVPAGLENQEWIKRYKAKVSECLRERGHLEVQFIDEPSAVFEYYRSQEKLNDEARLCLVLDVGGSTFNCAIVEQKGRKKDAKVHYASSVFYGGSNIDERLFVEALKDGDVIEQIDETFFDGLNHDKNACLVKSRLESIKISLSKRGPGKTEGHELAIPEGLINSTCDSVNVTREHLEKAVEFAWDAHWRKLSTLR